MDVQLEPVVKETNENRATFEAFCISLKPEELTASIPGTTWRVKDYIAHLATIDLFVADWFEHQADGKPWRPTGDGGGAFNIDTWNEARIQERLDATVPELLAEAAGLRARLWAAVDRFSPEVLAAEFDFRGHNITFLRYMELWVAHDPAHTADMLPGIPERRGEVEGWLGRYRLK